MAGIINTFYSQENFVSHENLQTGWRYFYPFFQREKKKEIKRRQHEGKTAWLHQQFWLVNGSEGSYILGHWQHAVGRCWDLSMTLYLGSTGNIKWPTQKWGQADWRQSEAEYSWQILLQQYLLCHQGIEEYGNWQWSWSFLVLPWVGSHQCLISGCQLFLLLRLTMCSTWCSSFAPGALLETKNYRTRNYFLFMYLKSSGFLTWIGLPCKTV